MPDVRVRLSGTNIVRAADHNQRTVLHAVLVHKAITRVALAKLTGLTAPAVANIVKRLLNDGLIEEVGRLRGSGRGQPGKLLQINPQGRFSIGVNIDRDHISLLLVNVLGTPLARRHLDVPFALPDEVRRYWEGEAEGLLAEADVDAASLIGIGVAMPDDLGQIYLPGLPPGYEAWQNIDIPGLFRKPFGVPVLIENDATAAALGEMRFGSGPELKSALYVLITSGLGGSLLIDGHAVRGDTGRSGEIGLIPLPDGTRVQDHVSLSALKAQLGSEELTLADLDDLGQSERAMAVFDKWLDGAVERLTPPLIAANCMLNPGSILIGARLPSALVDRVAEALEQALDAVHPALPSRAVVRRAQLSDNAPAIGAAILPFHHFLLPINDTLWKDEEE